MENRTKVIHFILQGLSNDPQLQSLLFLVFLLVYLITILANMVIMLVVMADSYLYTPMYFFLFHLAFVDICYSSAVVPKMLVDFLSGHKSITVNGCLAQMFFIFLPAVTEAFILSAMAYDRYAAICIPLRYVATMSKRTCVLLVSGSWAVGFIEALLNTALSLQLHFCGPDHIHHFSCELPPLLHLSCTDTTTNKVVLFTSFVILGSSSFLFTLISYIYIISTILQMQCAQGRQKAFSTCSSHLMVVGLLYLTAFFQYTKPSSISSVALEEMVSIQYSILTPMLNPIIYSLKNKEVKTAIGKMLGKSMFLKRCQS